MHSSLQEKHEKQQKHKNPSTMNGKTFDEKVKWLFKINRDHAKEFVRTRPLRQLYRVKHPTEICAFKCMDGRMHIPIVTHTPLGIIRPYRNIGGYFDLGWPLLGEDVTTWVQYGISKGRKSLILVTYHFSEGDAHRGCAGFNYDKEAAFRFTMDLHKQVNRLFGENNQVVFPIVVGLETDTDSLIFHPQDPTSNETIYRTTELPENEADLIEIITQLYPNMDPTVREDLLPLIQGNIAHIKEIKASDRNLDDMHHCEWVLGIGRGFDWLHEPNTALIVGPYSPDLSEPIIKAIGIIAENMRSGRTGDDGFLVLASAPFRENGIDENRAREKAIFFKNYVQKIIAKHYPDLLKKAKFLAVTVDEHTREALKIE